MKKKVVILGGSGIGMIAASTIERNNDAEVIGFLNDIEEENSFIGKYKKGITKIATDFALIMPDATPKCHAGQLIALPLRLIGCQMVFAAGPQARPGGIIRQRR